MTRQTAGSTTKNQSTGQLRRSERIKKRINAARQGKKPSKTTVTRSGTAKASGWEPREQAPLTAHRETANASSHNRACTYRNSSTQTSPPTGPPAASEVTLPLTKQNLRFLTAMTGPKSKRVAGNVVREKTQRDLPLPFEPTTSIAESGILANPLSGVSRSTITTTHPGLAQMLAERNVLGDSPSRHPSNQTPLLKRLEKNAPTSPPDLDQFTDYLDAIKTAPNELTIHNRILSLMKTYTGEGYGEAISQQLTIFREDLGSNNGIVAPAPDYIQGLRDSRFDDFPIRQLIPEAVLYPTKQNSLALAHIAGEVKATGHNPAGGITQCTYYGAALVYARNQALGYLGRSDPVNHASVITFFTNGERLDIYAHYVTKSRIGTTQYIQHQLACFYMLHSHQEFMRGYLALRNAQDYAKERAIELKEELIQHWIKESGVEPPIASDAEFPEREDQEEPECE
ncbi:hypothetical protein S7711_10455 [Stachybotrys chartarum IBT 7711]|uniref:Uncharacterized protein n=1 Tax=Stachybotrys chartarum (strain CBS 109288 / IBT 7711) TaxID=1280523 RepID=A0A084BBU8_STACB|nr:hypothetical protein S7711_10455 [Stachybotrys chartarum IBT 7711]